MTTASEATGEAGTAVQPTATPAAHVKHGGADLASKGRAPSSTRSRSGTNDTRIVFGAAAEAEEARYIAHGKEDDATRRVIAGAEDNGATVERTKVKLTLSRLLGEAKPERKTIAAATVCLFFSAICSLSVPALFGRIIDSIAQPDKPGAREELQKNVIALVSVAMLGAAFTFGRQYLFAAAGERVVARLHKKLFHAIMQQEVGFFDATRTGELVSRLSSDTSVLKQSVTSNISMGLRWSATVIGGVLFLFFMSWKLTLVMITVVPAVAWGAVYYGRYVRGLAKRTRRALAKATEVATESISSVRTVRSFAREEKREEMFSARVTTTLGLGLKSALASGLFSGGASGAFTLSFVGLVYYGGWLVLEGDITSGVLTSFLLYSLTIAGALAGLASLFGDLMKSVGASDRVFQILDRRPFIPLRGGKTLDAVCGDVAFEDVHFSYPTRPDQPVLAGMCLRIPAGKVAALVGPSGGGKSTVVNLLERFYDVQQGAVTIDGVAVATMDPSWLREQIGLVRQEPQLFCATISENIAFGVPSARMRDVIAAAKRANAHDFIMGFPDGYDTLVGERGVRLSGGQKQRIAIARALLKDPKVLLLDEATSALDAESEHLVQEALDRLMVGRTVLIIAHRLSTVKNADKVMVLDGGVVQACGPHDELMQTSPLYAKLVKHQLLQQKAELEALAGSGNAEHHTSDEGDHSDTSGDHVGPTGAGAGAGAGVGAGAGAAPSPRHPVAGTTHDDTAVVVVDDVTPTVNASEDTVVVEVSQA